MSRTDPSAAQLPAPRAEIGALRVFVAVARCGAVGRAAERLGRTQPSVSARLANLEALWNTRLFRRGGRGMQLTPEGERLLPLAESVLADLEKLDRAAGISIHPRDEVRIGAGDALGRRMLPRALGRLIRERPGTEVQLREGPRPLLLEALRRGEIDVALVVDAPGSNETNRGDLEIDGLVDSQVELLVPTGWGGPAEEVPIGLLADERCIALQPGSGFRRHLEAAFAAVDALFRPAVEVGNLSLVRRFVVAGLGVAPVPAVAFSPARNAAGLERRSLRGIAALHYEIAIRRGVPLNPATSRLLELLR